MSGQGAGQAPHSVRHSLRKQGIQKYNQSSMDPRFYSEGDECEWARVAKVQGKHPSQSVILCESRESRNTISQAWTPAFTARVTKVSGQGAGQAPHSVRHSLRKQGIQKYNQSSMDPRFYSEGDECEWMRVTKVRDWLVILDQ